eukprot:4006309-Pleurochrysis_carterae.AAC.2
MPRNMETRRSCGRILRAHLALLPATDASSEHDHVYKVKHDKEDDYVYGGQKSLPATEAG